MNATQEKAIEKLRRKFEERTARENEGKDHKLEIKKFDIRSSEQSFIDLVGYDLVQVDVSIGYVGDEESSFIRFRDYWNITIGPRGGFSTKIKKEDGERAKTTVHGFTECFYKGRYQL